MSKENKMKHEEPRDPEVNAEPAVPEEKAQEPDQTPTPEMTLEEAIGRLMAERDQYLTLAQRIQADFDNYRRRNQNLRTDAMDDGVRLAAQAMLPVLDNLRRAVDAAETAGTPDDGLLGGVRMVLRQMQDAFAGLGAEEIDPKGEPFDPNRHNAVMKGEATVECPSGTVLETLQKGCCCKGRVLRPAMVKVAQ